MLQILQPRLQQYMNQELPDGQAEFLKRQRNQRSNCQHQLDHRKSKRIPEKHLPLLHWPLLHWCAKVFVWITTNWKILKEMGIPDHLTCLLRNLYTGQETRVRSQYGTMDWFKPGKGVRQGCILSPCLFNLYVEHTAQLKTTRKGWWLSW